VKIKGGIDEISLPNVEALPTTEPLESGLHLMVIHCVAAERGGLIKKERTKKEKFTGKIFPD